MNSYAWGMNYDEATQVVKARDIHISTERAGDGMFKIVAHANVGSQRLQRVAAEEGFRVDKSIGETFGEEQRKAFVGAVEELIRKLPPAT